MTAAQTSLNRIVTCIENLEFLKGKGKSGSISAEDKEILDGYKNKFIQAMEDDLNTAEAISFIFEAVRAINTNVKSEPANEYIDYSLAILRELTGVLGIAAREKAETDSTEIEKLIADRAMAKKEKDFKKADEIRQILLDMGVVIEDTREGTKWKFQ